MRAWDPVTTRARILAAQRAEIGRPESVEALEEEIESAQSSNETAMAALRATRSGASAGGEVKATSVLRELQDIEILARREDLTPESLSEWLTEATYEATKIPGQ